MSQFGEPGLACNSVRHIYMDHGLPARFDNQVFNTKNQLWNMRSFIIRKSQSLLYLGNFIVKQLLN